MRKEKVFAGIFLFIGIGIIGLWTMLFFTNQIIELETEPKAIVFHIVIELSMGVMAIISGIMLLKNIIIRKEMIMFTNGMLFYSVVNSSGYYAELGEIAMILMFGLILVFVVYNSWYFLKNEVA